MYDMGKLESRRPHLANRGMIMVGWDNFLYTSYSPLRIQCRRSPAGFQPGPGIAHGHYLQSIFLSYHLPPGSKVIV